MNASEDSDGRVVLGGFREMSPPPRGVRGDRGWTFEFADDAVWQLSFDFAVTITTEQVTARIEGDFELHDGAQMTVIEPGVPTHAAAIVALHQAALKRVALAESGELQMEFGEAKAIVVSPSDNPYEAFDVTVAGGWRFIGTPGGGLASWAPDEPTGTTTSTLG